jgi:hypothetical protein
MNALSKANVVGSLPMSSSYFSYISSAAAIADASTAGASSIRS